MLRTSSTLCCLRPLVVAAFLTACSHTAGAQTETAAPPVDQQPTEQIVDAGSTTTREQPVAINLENDTTKLRDRFNSFQFSDVLPDGLNQNAFEESLENQFYGTYVFYAKLSADGRQVVYDSYLADPHIASVRAATLDMLR
jgi:hypothetical protein